MKNVLDIRRLRELFTSINPRTIYLYSIVIGVLAGLGAIVFNELLHAATEITMHTWAQLSPPQPHGEACYAAAPIGPPRRWLLLLLPIGGGLMLRCGKPGAVERASSGTVTRRDDGGAGTVSAAAGTVGPRIGGGGAGAGGIKASRPAPDMRSWAICDSPSPPEDCIPAGTSRPWESRVETVSSPSASMEKKTVTGVGGDGFSRAKRPR